MDTALVVNPKIKDAVTTTNQAVLGAAAQEAVAAVRQQVAQSTGLAIQDAIDQLQQTLVLNSAVTGKALSIILTEPEKAPQALLALQTAQSAVNNSISWMTNIGEAAAGILNDYPSP